jgi:aspartyl aminopeptidase
LEDAYYIAIAPVNDWRRKTVYTLDAKSRENIFEATGMTVEQIIDMDFEDIDARIGKKVGHKIKKYIVDERLASRGQVYSEMERFLHMDEADKGLKKHDRRKSPFVKKVISTI